MKESHMSCSTLESTRRSLFHPKLPIAKSQLEIGVLIDTNDFMTIQKNDDDLQKRH